MFIAALFTIARTWKQPKCPSTDEWIKKMWHVYTMEYYSAMKRNEIELFVVRWMDLDSVIQSEVSQKEKNKYRMLMHIYGILKKKNGSDEPRGKTGIKKDADVENGLACKLLTLSFCCNCSSSCKTYLSIRVSPKLHFPASTAIRRQTRDLNLLLRCPRTGL